MRRSKSIVVVDAGDDINLEVGSTKTTVIADISGLEGGKYDVEVKVLAPDGTTYSDTMSINVAKPPEPPVTTEGVTALILIDAANDKELFEMRDGGAYNLEIVGSKLNIKANVSSNVAKVTFALSGAMMKGYTDKAAPFSLWGDDGNGNFYYGSWNPPAEGSYNIKATPFDAAGKELPAKELEFSFFRRTEPTPEPPQPEPPQPSVGKIQGFGAATTGGEGGTEVTVTTGSELAEAAKGTTKRIIRVQGSFPIGYCMIGSNKTIVGTRGQVSKLSGTLRIEGAENVLVSDLDLTAPIVGTKTYDAIAIVSKMENGVVVTRTRNVVIDQCNIVDWTDGGCDITKGATNVTIRNTRFAQTKSYDHALAVLIGADPADADEGYLDVSIYGCLFDVGISDRMPFCRKGRIHVWNNVKQAYASWMYLGKVSSYATAAEKAQLLSENEVVKNGEDPFIKKEVGGKIKNTGTKYYPEVTKIVNWNDAVFTPPYEYELLPTDQVEAYVMANAGRLK